MERLTFSKEFAEAEKIYRNNIKYIKPEIALQTYSRLSEYEDIGLTPSEITEKLARLDEAIEAFNELADGLAPPYKVRDMLLEYKKLKKEIADGRMVELPCKVGTTVYRIVRKRKGRNWTKETAFIQAVVFNKNNFWKIIFGGDFGKTVFLTRESAEAALKEGKE